MARASVLIIEDEPKIAQLLADFLELDDFQSHIINDGAHALDAIKDLAPDCVILDLMLPNKDGLNICKEARLFTDVPIIMLTARIDEIDRLKGLKSGADDYVCKPFSPKEVVARVEAILRRTKNIESSLVQKTFSYKEIKLDVSAFTCFIQHTPVDLTPVEFKLLLALIKSSGIVLSREQLMAHCYDDGRIVSDRTIDSHMKNVKHKLNVALPNTQYVHSVYGIGYKLV